MPKNNTIFVMVVFITKFYKKNQSEFKDEKVAGLKLNAVNLFRYFLGADDGSWKSSQKLTTLQMI